MNYALRKIHIICKHYLFDLSRWYWCPSWRNLTWHIPNIKVLIFHHVRLNFRNQGASFFGVSGRSSRSVSKQMRNYLNKSKLPKLKSVRRRGGVRREKKELTAEGLCQPGAVQSHYGLRSDPAAGQEQKGAVAPDYPGKGWSPNPRLRPPF